MRSDRRVRWLVLGGAILLLAGPAHAAEKCLPRSIDSVGRCHQRGFAKRVVDREVRGTQGAPVATPDGVDANLLATELAGQLSTGEWFPVKGGPHDWVLVVRRGEIGPAFTIQASGRDDNLQFVALLRIVPAAAGAGGKPAVTLIARADSLIADTTAGQTGRDGPTSAPAAPPAPKSGVAPVPCVDPEADHGDDEDSGGGYPDIAGDFRWLTLSPGHRVLAAGVSRSEGYAGGGGMFAGEVLLEVRDDRLVSVACFARSRYQMFGGEWNADGTRQHPESQAAWAPRVQRPGRGADGRWPALSLIPLTGGTPAVLLKWDTAAEHYAARSKPASSSR